MITKINNNIYIHPSVGKQIKTGIIEEGCYRIIDKDNLHTTSNSLGIDKEILYSEELEFVYITMKFHSKTLATTRRFFIDHAKKQNILNFRDMLFLPIKDFSLASALKYEKNLYSEALNSLDIFEIAKKNDGRLLRGWIDNIKSKYHQK